MLAYAIYTSPFVGVRVTADEPLPLFPFNVTLYTFVFHCAARVTFPYIPANVFPIAYEPFNVQFPATAVAFQFKNEYPVLVMLANASVLSTVYDVTASEANVPLFAVYVIVYVLTVHCAYNVVPSVADFVQLLASTPVLLISALPPLFAANQPLNVYPFLEAVGAIVLPLAVYG